MNKLTEALKLKFGENIFTRTDVKMMAKELGLPAPKEFLSKPEYKVSRGKYRILDVDVKTENKMNQKEINIPIVKVENTINMMISDHKENLIPEKDPLFVKHGPYEDVSKIIASRIFYPLYITGLSGNGKTFSVEQACSENKRELIRVNITIETDEDDLLGGFRLVNDSTKWFDGPVIRAMKTGAVLLIDEVDLGSTKLMCLQPILEGKGVLLKKINQFIKPAPGFNIIATANTKGQGSETGKFIGTNIMNEAFLERFPATFEQPYPDESIETKILSKVFAKHNIEKEVAKDFTDKLIKWAVGTRKSFQEEASSDLISTRRLVHIANAFAVLGDRRKAIEVCIARFDDTTKYSFIQLYEKFDPSIVPEELRVQDETQNSDGNKLNDITAILTGPHNS